MSRLLIAIGLLIVLIGLLWPFFAKLHIGHLPGDIVIHRSNFTIYLPLMTMLIVSLLLGLIRWMLRR